MSTAANSTRDASRPPPNVLFIICDDLNNAISGMGRTPCAPCPNLQRLMAGAVRFPNAYSNCPVCFPARNSLFSGLYPHTTGSFTLWDDWRTVTPLATTAAHGAIWGRPLLRDAVMMPRHFKDNGYQVYGTGKTLHQGRVNDAWWTEYHDGPDYGPFLWDAADHRQRCRPDREWLFDGEPMASYARRYEGVDRFFLDGDRFRHHIEKAFGPLDDLLSGHSGPVLGTGGRPYRYVNDDDRDPLPDERYADWAVNVLGREHTAPFFLGVGFMKPHTPLNAPRRFFDMFPPDELDLPPYRADDIDDCARALVEHRPYGFLTYDLLMKGGERFWREWLQAYLACVAFVDEQIGRVLEALDASPYAENTVVVFTSDNGYHMGEKSYVFKDSLWEEGGQIPLMIRAPGVGQQGAVCTTPVSHVDLYPTLVDLCGLPRNPHAETHGLPLEGHSLRPLLAAPQSGSWDGPAVALSSVRGDTGVHHSVRSATHRYTLCGNGEEELYDHRSDPNEWHNLAASPACDGVRSQLREQMMALLWPER